MGWRVVIMDEKTGLVPEEASDAFEAARSEALAGPTASLANYRGLQAAAPLILAAELERQADRIADSAKAWRDPRPGTAAYSMAGVLADVIVELRERASVLRGEGD